jgi:hypothetical protein
MVRGRTTIEKHATLHLGSLGRIRGTSPRDASDHWRFGVPRPMQPVLMQSTQHFQSRNMPGAFPRQGTLNLDRSMIAVFSSCRYCASKGSMGTLSP